MAAVTDALPSDATVTPARPTAAVHETAAFAVLDTAIPASVADDAAATDTADALDTDRPARVVLDVTATATVAALATVRPSSVRALDDVTSTAPADATVSPARVVFDVATTDDGAALPKNALVATSGLPPRSILMSVPAHDRERLSHFPRVRQARATG